MSALRDARILVTGPTGQVAQPVAISLAADNEVVAAARFRDPAARADLEAAGIRCLPADLVAGKLDALPERVDYVLHFAAVRSNKWPIDLDGNVGGLALLMERYRDARAFLHVSTTAVYQPDGHRAFAEDDPLGDNHRAYYMETYSISKIAAEAVARHGARRWGLPTTIARLNVPYGDRGGWPAMHLEQMAAGQPIDLHHDAPSEYHPLHSDDIVAMVPRLLAVAGVPPTTVNWGGDARVSIEQWCAYLGELTGLTPTFRHTDRALQSVALDLTRMHELIGHPQVGWKDGFRRMVAARRPDLLAANA